MQNSKNFLRSRPILKPKPQQLHLSIDLQPPTQNRLPPDPTGVNISPKNRHNREKLSLRESIDYDKLSPSEQAKWDAGIYGSIHLKSDRGYDYYVVRWVDPRTGSLRSNSLGKTFDAAKAKLKEMILG
jgi:hypothetical protein